MEDKKNRIPELFGSRVFSDTVMRERLPEEVYLRLRRTMEEGRSLDPAIADTVAEAMKEWATEQGATHYTHWFQPLTGITAEKHESFIHPTADGRIIMDFRGKELIKGEPDASSFPNGGLRSTFEARGYTAWDPTAYAFIKDNTLCIPTVFYSYGGEALDKKTPLLRSEEAVNRQALRILRLFGNTEVKRVTVTVGAEQEYFLISRKKYYQRPDLVICGRTLFGARPSKGQELEDHYFGTIKPRVAEFMADLDEELWKLGILAKTEHNEVAPAQHELAPIFSDANNALDDNQLTMETMKKVARRHDLACLLHEKPFEGINGSGKHNNWSLVTDTGVNLLEPGDSPAENAQFLLFLAAMIRGVDEYQDLLRVCVADANNDHRLGGNEAPPAILSMFLGEELTEILETIESGDDYNQKDRTIIKLGVHMLPRFARDMTDRNRTSPFAFTGNKFEFRMPGAGSSISGPDVMMNTIAAESLSVFADRIEQDLAAGMNLEDSLEAIVRETMRDHKRIIFNGNNYSPEWREEALRRGLSERKTTVDALPAYLDPKNIALFKKHQVYTEVELKSRYEISHEMYGKTIHMEALTMVDMTFKDILPSVSRYVEMLSDSVVKRRAALGMLPPPPEMGKVRPMGAATVPGGAPAGGQFMETVRTHEEILVRELTELSYSTFTKARALEEKVQTAETIKSAREQARSYSQEIVPAMAALRQDVDRMERLTGEEYWPYPTYSKLLFYV